MKTIQKKVNAVIQLLETKMANAMLIHDEFAYVYEEYLVFNTKANMNKMKNKYFKAKNIYILSNICKFIIEHISIFEYTGQKSKLLQFGCYYDGKKTLMYNDEILQKTDYDFALILLNHVFHYLNGFYRTRINEKKQLSYQLLCFDNIGMCDTNITYSQIGRATLIDKYPEQIEKLKLFSSTKLNKVNIVTDAGYRHDLHITQQNIRFNIHSYMCSKIICIDKTDICFDDIENIMLKAEKEIKITII